MKIRNLKGEIVEHEVVMEEPLSEEEEDMLEEIEEEEEEKPRYYDVLFKVSIEVSASVEDIDILSEPQNIENAEYSLDMPVSYGDIDYSGTVRVRADSEDEAVEIVREMVEKEDVWELSRGWIEGVTLEWAEADEVVG